MVQDSKLTGRTFFESTQSAGYSDYQMNGQMAGIFLPRRTQRRHRAHREKPLKSFCDLCVLSVKQTRNFLYF